MSESDYHEGRVHYRDLPTMILRLCPCGHVLGGFQKGPAFAGSAFEAEMSDPPVMRCYGTLPKATG